MAAKAPPAVAKAVGLTLGRAVRSKAFLDAEFFLACLESSGMARSAAMAILKTVSVEDECWYRTRS